MPRRAARLAGALGAALVVPALLAGSAVAQPAPDAEAAAEPILRQLEAFRRDDFDTAYTFASEAIQQLFDRPAFERMVRTGYPEIARSAGAVVWRTEAAPDGHVYVRMKIRGANGNAIDALYDMVWEAGRWRINGVVARPDPGLA